MLLWWVLTLLASPMMKIEAKWEDGPWILMSLITPISKRSFWDMTADISRPRLTWSFSKNRNSNNGLKFSLKIKMHSFWAMHKLTSRSQRPDKRTILWVNSTKKTSLMVDIKRTKDHTGVFNSERKKQQPEYNTNELNILTKTKLFKPLIILILKKINNFKKWPSFRFLMVNFEPKWSKIDKKNYQYKCSCC
jgi:hypothetical protein